MSIAENLQRVQAQIEQAAHHAGRKPHEIKLVAVSKNFPVPDIIQAFEAGVRNIGENRVEEAGFKIPQVRQAASTTLLRWHLIGHLQRRKARDALALFDMIQSVDTVRLAQTLDRHASVRPKPLPILLQVNIGNDPQKFGFTAEPRSLFFDAVERILGFPNLDIEGLMTIGPLVPSAEETRPFFRSLRGLRDELAQRFPEATWRELSMGMTDDYAVAIEEGATIVRIGRAIFGQRN
jgi:pyridoxal phosphate enzyme (YggS family)